MDARRTVQAMNEGHLPASFPVLRAQGVLLAAIMIVWMGFTVLFPLLGPLGREMGLSEIQITSIIGASSFTFFLMTPVWGRLSDRHGRKRIMLVGLFGFSLGTLVFNSVLYAGLQGLLGGFLLFVTLVVARVFIASLMSASMPTSTAYMADITAPDVRTRGMTLAGAASNLGSILGPALALLTVFSLLMPLWTIAAVAFLNGLFVLLFLPESPFGRIARRHHERIRFNDVRILPFLVVGIMMFVGNAIVQQTMGFRFQDALHLDARETAITLGLSMLLAAVAALLVQVFVVQRTRRAPFTLLKIAIPLLAIAFAMIAAFESRILLMAAMVIQGMGMGIALPAFMAGASLAVSAENQGVVAGLASACGPLGASIGPIVGGFLYQINSPLPYAFATVLYLLLIVAMPWLESRVHVHSDPNTVN